MNYKAIDKADVLKIKHIVRLYGITVIDTVFEKTEIETSENPIHITVCFKGYDQDINSKLCLYIEERRCETCSLINKHVSLTRDEILDYAKEHSVIK